MIRNFLKPYDFRLQVRKFLDIEIALTAFGTINYLYSSM